MIKEDREAFRLLVGKSRTPSEAVALASAEPDQTLR